MFSFFFLDSIVVFLLFLFIPFFSPKMLDAFSLSPIVCCCSPPLPHHSLIVSFHPRNIKKRHHHLGCSLIFSLFFLSIASLSANLSFFTLPRHFFLLSPSRIFFLPISLFLFNYSSFFSFFLFLYQKIKKKKSQPCSSVHDDPIGDKSTKTKTCPESGLQPKSRASCFVFDNFVGPIFAASMLRMIIIMKLR